MCRRTYLWFWSSISNAIWPTVKKSWPSCARNCAAASFTINTVPIYSIMSQVTSDKPRVE